jgi:hypothetical protein
VVIREGALISRRVWLVAGSGILSGLLAGYASAKTRKKPRIPFLRALALLPSIHTESELNAQFGPPHSVEIFDPGPPTAANSENMPREHWHEVKVFIPPTLIDTLPVGTRMVINIFQEWGYLAAGGALIAYVDARGQLLGWSYSVAFTDKRIAKGAALRDLP